MPHLAASPRDLMLHDIDEREVLEHRYDVRECFVEGHAVRLSHLREARMNAVATLQRLVAKARRTTSRAGRWRARNS